MKRILSIVTVSVLAASSLIALPTYAQNTESPQSVVDWMYWNNLTIFNTQQDFGWDRAVTRGEISKFFTKFAELIGKQKTRTTAECQFDDIDGYDYTLKPTIIEACEYGLVKGFQGNYFPNKNLTGAEALTVIIRAVLGPLDETGNPWWTRYHTAGQSLAILDSEGVWDLDKPVTRGTVGTWLFRAGKVDIDTVVNEWSDELKKTLNDIFGFTDSFWE